VNAAWPENREPPKNNQPNTQHVKGASGCYVARSWNHNMKFEGAGDAEGHAQSRRTNPDRRGRSEDKRGQRHRGAVGDTDSGAMPRR